MATRISDSLGVAEDKFESLGVLNGFVDLDSLFYIDPHLLKKVTTPELKNSYKKFKEHFRVIIKLLQNCTHENDPFWRKARKLLVIKEIPNISLGYSKNDNLGNAIGPTTAEPHPKAVPGKVEISDVLECFFMYSSGVMLSRAEWGLNLL